MRISDWSSDVCSSDLLGCYSSHFTIWREMAEQGIAQCIVLEDDTIVDWAFMAQLAATDLAARDIPYLRLYSKFPTFSRIVERDFLQHSRSVEFGRASCRESVCQSV